MSVATASRRGVSVGKRQAWGAHPHTSELQMSGVTPQLQTSAYGVRTSITDRTSTYRVDDKSSFRSMPYGVQDFASLPFCKRFCQTHWIWITIIMVRDHSGHNLSRLQL